MILSMIKGTSVSFEINLTDDSGQSYDLGAGESIIFGVKRNVNGTAYDITKTITTKTQGKYVCTIAPSDTINLEAGKYYYDIGVQSGSDYFIVVPLDAFVIEQNITKAV